MEIAFTEEHAYSIKETLNWEEAKESAWDKKTTVFGGGLGKFFTRPKADDVKITDQEKRWQPFWHVRCSALFVYDRTRHYQVPIAQPEVRTVLIDQREYVPSGEPRSFTLAGLEKCEEKETAERFIDAVNGEPKDLEHYLEFEEIEIPDISDWHPEESIVVPPQVRATTIVREVLSTLIKPLDADTVHEDLVTIDKVNLYFRPVYAFEFQWTPKERSAVAEFDGLTGKLITEGANIRETVGRVLTPEVLFDVGVDAIDLLVPGGGIAIKLAKAAASSKK